MYLVVTDSKDDKLFPTVMFYAKGAWAPKTDLNRAQKIDETLVFFYTKWVLKIYTCT